MGEMVDITKLQHNWNIQVFLWDLSYVDWSVDSYPTSDNKLCGSFRIALCSACVGIKDLAREIHLSLLYQLALESHCECLLWWSWLLFLDQLMRWYLHALLCLRSLRKWIFVFVKPHLERNTECPQLGEREVVIQHWGRMG